MALYSNRQYHQSLHHSSCRSHTSSYHDTRNPHHSPLLLQSMACPRCSRSRRPRNARPKAAVGCGSSRLLSRSPLQLSLPHFRSPSQSVSLSQSPSPSLQTLSLRQQLSPPSQGSLRGINITNQVSHNSRIPAAIIS